MTADAILSSGFRLIEDRKGPVDERGIDRIMILEKKFPRSGLRKTDVRFFVSAHYAKTGQWGEPLPIARAV